MTYPVVDLLSTVSFYITVILNSLIVLSALRWLLQKALSWDYEEDFANALPEESNRSGIYLAKNHRSGKRNQPSETKRSKVTGQKNPRSYSARAHDGIQRHQVGRPEIKDSRFEPQPMQSPRQSQTWTQKNALYAQILEEVRQIRCALDKF